jgi:hypothetical protein
VTSVLRARPPRGAATPLVAAGLLLLACAPPAPEPHTRVSGWAPTGSGVPPGAVAAIQLSGPADPAGLADGRRVALARGADVRAVVAAVESEGGIGEATPALGCDVALLDGGRRVELRPRAPLAAGTVHALVLGPVHDTEGRPVLDPDGRRRTFVATFQVEPGPPGPPPRPVLTEVLADAAAPEAGGEYLEVQNRGEAPLDLAGWRLEKRTSTGSLAGCELLQAVGGPLPPGGLALLTGGDWDGRYPLPAATPRWTCGGATLAGGLANDRPPEVRLVDPAGAVVTTLGSGGVAPRCPVALERRLPEGPDAADNLACVEVGSPGRCNFVTPAEWCP